MEDVRENLLELAYKFAEGTDLGIISETKCNVDLGGLDDVEREVELMKSRLLLQCMSPYILRDSHFMEYTYCPINSEVLEHVRDYEGTIIGVNVMSIEDFTETTRGNVGIRIPNESVVDWWAENRENF